MLIYDISVQLENGNVYTLDRYKGKVLLIVNTATKCGYAPQFEELEVLYKKYKDQGLVVLGFPSNQFEQELDDSHAAAEACRLTYGVTFPMHKIGDVNGMKTQSLFAFLKNQATGIGASQSIKWNFTKFLVDRQGNVVKRAAPQTTPLELIQTIEELLENPK